MITKEDKIEVGKLQQFLESKIQNDGVGPDVGKFWDWCSLLGKLVNNLEKAPKSYRPSSYGDEFYDAGCEECGWWGSSELLDGGGQIADTGDYSDSFCPVCGNFDIVVKTYFGVDKNGKAKHRL